MRFYFSSRYSVREAAVDAAPRPWLDADDGREAVLPVAVPLPERRLGPCFASPERGRILILDGGLAGEEYDLSVITNDISTRVRLTRDGAEIGNCAIQRYAREETAVLWHITVRPDLQGNGLASLMVKVGFREVLGTCATPSFGIRMLRLLDPGERAAHLRNIGIGVIAQKLGFTFRADLERLLSPLAVERVELIPSRNGTPPGYRILLRSYPLVLVGFLVNPRTGMPLTDTDDFWLERTTLTLSELRDRHALLVVGNGDYRLRRDGIPKLIRCLATDEVEASLLARRITPTT